MQKIQEMQVQSLGREDPLEEEVATHSNILSRIIPWTEEPDRRVNVHGVAESQTQLNDWACTHIIVLLWVLYMQSHCHSARYMGNTQTLSCHLGHIDYNSNVVQPPDLSVDYVGRFGPLPRSRKPAWEHPSCYLPGPLRLQLKPGRFSRSCKPREGGGEGEPCTNQRPQGDMPASSF